MLEPLKGAYEEALQSPVVIPGAGLVRCGARVIMDIIGEVNFGRKRMLINQEDFRLGNEWGEKLMMVGMKAVRAFVRLSFNFSGPMLSEPNCFYLSSGDLLIAKQVEQSSDESKITLLKRLCTVWCSTYFEMGKATEWVRLLVSGQSLETLQITARTFYEYEKLSAQALYCLQIQTKALTRITKGFHFGLQLQHQITDFLNIKEC